MKQSTSSPKRKPRRSYASPLRAAQAAQTRQRILDSAVRLFAEGGYSATTLPDIAAEAEVSVETIQAHGPKRALLLAAFRTGLRLHRRTGLDFRPARDRPIERADHRPSRTHQSHLQIPGPGQRS